MRYPAKLHASKVAEELGVKNGLIYLRGETEKSYEYSDMGPRFRQKRYFFYLSGLNFAGCAVTYHIRERKLILWVPRSDPKQVLWYGRIPSFEDCLAASDVDSVQDINHLPIYLKHQVFWDGPDSRVYCLDVSSLPPPGLKYDIELLRPAMDAARVIKTEYEIAQIRKANEISSAAHAAVAREFKNMKNEREVEALFLMECVRRGAKNQAYPVIAGAGINAATLHYEENSAPLDGNQLLVLDAGCEWGCYASDVTRTLPIGGTFQSKEAREIYQIVHKMQSQCIMRAIPGKVYYELHVLANRIVALELSRLGILKSPTSANGESMDIETLLLTGVTAAFFPHGLGHHVGLETHDVTGKERLLMNYRFKEGEGWSWRGMESKEKRMLFTASDVAAMVRAERGWRGLVDEDSDRKRRMQESRNVIRWGGVGYDMFTANTKPDPLKAWAAPPPYAGRQKLQPGMVVTIEPGIYFCREWIEGYFLSDPNLARFIDVDVLERYYPIGGVRIEDDILITEDGNENLTTAPKIEG